MDEDKVVCQICGEEKSVSELLRGDTIQPELRELARIENPRWSDEDELCFRCLDDLRNHYVRWLMEKDLGDLDSLEKEVVQSLRDNEILAENINEEYDQNLSLGERIADRVAEFGGSWAFIFTFALFMLLWVATNTWVLATRPFDPYPFILLNLFLSMLAAIQAPIIMMSQNRQEDRDRLRAENDYQVNLKAELEVRMINEKLDYLTHDQWQRMLKVQQIQMEMIRDLRRGRTSHDS